MYYEVLSLVLEKEKKYYVCYVTSVGQRKNLSTETEGRGEWNFLMNEWNCSAVSSGENTR